MAHFYGTTLCTQKLINNIPKSPSPGWEKQVKREATRENCCDCKGTLAGAEMLSAFMMPEKKRQAEQ